MKKRIIITLYILLTVMLMMACGNGKQADTNNNSTDNNQEKNTEPEEQVIEPEFKVVIDAGHGGEDPGTTGASGKFEKDFTLSLAQKVQELIEQESEIAVFMTREDDVFLTSEGSVRAEFANDIDADIFVSIHANAFDDSSVSGTESFYYKEEDKLLANVLQKYVAPATGFNNRGLKSDSLFVLRDTHMPATLLEIGYISNPEDEQKMLSEGFQQTVAEAIVKGMKEFLGVDPS